MGGKARGWSGRTVKIWEYREYREYNKFVLVDSFRPRSWV
jgi:hypothetical protein